MPTPLFEQMITDNAPLLAPKQLAAHLETLPDWTLIGDGTAITRKFTTRSFLAAQSLATLIGGIAQLANHHPDIAYGWGYCHVTFTTHSAEGVTLNDLICAARIDLIVRKSA